MKTDRKGCKKTIFVDCSINCMNKITLKSGDNDVFLVPSHIDPNGIE
jgi:hypothetical protein